MALAAYGMNRLGSEWVTPSELSTLAEADVKLYRVALTPDGIDWFDTVVQRCAEAGVTVLPILIDQPDGVTKAPTTTTGRQQFGYFATACAQRWGPGGTFWDENPGLTALPIRCWEVWNEPNLRPFWNGKPSVEQFYRLLKATRLALRAVDANARIIFGGLANRENARPYLRDFLEAHSDSDRIFDALGFHPYARTAGEAVRAVGGMRDILDDADLDTVPIWITEIGWASPGKASRYTTTEDGQAQRLHVFAKAMEKRRSSWHIGPVCWYVLKDADPGPWYHNAGVFHEGPDVDSLGDAKPAWIKLRDHAQAAADLALPTVRT